MSAESTPVNRAISALLELFPKSGQPTTSVSYSAAFNDLWGDPSAQFENSGTCVITSERRPSYPPVGAINLQNYTTIYDWLVATSLRIREAHGDQPFPHRFIVVDALSSSGSESWSFEAIDQLSTMLPWIRVIRKNEVSQIIRAILDVISSPRITATGAAKSLDLVRTVWRGRLTDAARRGDRHAIANLVAPQILLPLTTAHVGIGALHQLLSSVGLAPKTRPSPAQVKLTGDVYLVLIDDMAAHGWTDFIKMATGLNGERLAVLTDVNRDKLQDDDTLFELLKKRAAAIANASPFLEHFSLQGRPDEIVLLDLRLFSSDSEERTFHEQLLGFARTAKLLDNIPAEGSGWAHPDDALTLLPRLIAALDPSLPIIVFSSTGSRRVHELLSKVPSIILEFEKPRFFGDDSAGIVERAHQQFAAAMAKAMRLSEARRLLRQVVTEAKKTQDTPPPKRLHLFIDESGADRRYFAVGAVIVGSASDNLQLFNKTLESTAIDEGRPANKIYWNLSETAPEYEDRKERIQKDATSAVQDQVLRTMQPIAEQCGCTLTAASLRTTVLWGRTDDALDDRNLDNLYRLLLANLLEMLLFDLYDWPVQYEGNVTVDVATRLGLYRGKDPAGREKEREDFFLRFGLQPLSKKKNGVRKISDRNFYSLSLDHVVPLLSAIQAYREPQHLPHTTAARGTRLVQPNPDEIKRSAEQAAEPYTILLPHQIHYLADWVSRWASTSVIPDEAKDMFVLRMDCDTKEFKHLQTAFRAGGRGDFASALVSLHDAISENVEGIPFFAWRRGREWVAALTPEMFAEVAFRLPIIVRGTVKWFEEAKKFGFITTEAGDDVFLHSSEICASSPLTAGMKVEFEVVQNPKGLAAVNVRSLQTTRTIS